MLEGEEQQPSGEKAIEFPLHKFQPIFFYTWLCIVLDLSSVLF